MSFPGKVQYLVKKVLPHEHEHVYEHEPKEAGVSGIPSPF
jgi:hypothetical protein